MQGTVTTLAALLQGENQESMQRAIVDIALIAQPPVLLPNDLAVLQQAAAQERADLADFNASANTSEQELFSNTVSGRAVDIASSQEILAEQNATANPPKPLTSGTGLDADREPAAHRHRHRGPAPAADLGGDRLDAGWVIHPVTAEVSPVRRPGREPRR